MRAGVDSDVSMQVLVVWEIWYLKSLGSALRLSSTRYYLDFVGLDNLPTILHLEGYILQLEGPNFVAETVGIQGSLRGCN